MFCSNCKTEMKGNAKFCCNCGNALDGFGPESSIVGIFYELINELPDDFKIDGVYISPDIPGDKLSNVLNGYFEGYESDVKLLIDNTVFGSASEGAVVTDTAIYIKNGSKEPVYLPFSQINKVENKCGFLYRRIIFNEGTVLDLAALDKDTVVLLEHLFNEIIGTDIDNTDKESISVENDFVSYYAPIFALAGKIAKSDGIVTPEEINEVEEFIENNLEFNIEEREFAIAVFNEAKDASVTVEEYLDLLVEIAEPEQCKAIVSFLVGLTIVDGELSDCELDILLIAEKILELPKGFVNETLKQFGWYNDNYEKREDPTFLKYHYDVLGLTEFATDDEVMKSYRKKVNEFHPDKIASKGLPPEFMKFASEKFIEVQAAYDAIRDNRNL